MHGVVELAAGQGSAFEKVLANVRSADPDAPCRLSAGASGWWGLAEFSHPLGAVVAVPAQLSRPAVGLQVDSTVSGLTHTFVGPGKTRLRRPSYLRYEACNAGPLSLPSAPSWQALGVVSARCAETAGLEGLQSVRSLGARSVLSAASHVEQLEANLNRTAVILEGAGRQVELPYRPFTVGVSAAVFRRPGVPLASAAPVEVWVADRWLALQGALGAVYLRRSSPWAPRARP